MDRPDFCDARLSCSCPASRRSLLDGSARRTCAGDVQPKHRRRKGFGALRRLEVIGAHKGPSQPPPSASEGVGVPHSQPHSPSSITDTSKAPTEPHLTPHVSALIDQAQQAYALPIAALPAEYLQ